MSNTKQELLNMVLNTVKQLEDEDNTVDNFMEDVLSIESICKDPQGNWKGAELCWAYGGPGIYIDTQYNKVEGYWGSDSITRTYDDNIGLDEFLEEIYG